MSAKISLLYECDNCHDSAFKEAVYDEEEEDYIIEPPPGWYEVSLNREYVFCEGCFLRLLSALQEFINK